MQSANGNPYGLPTAARAPAKRRGSNAPRTDPDTSVRPTPCSTVSTGNNEEKMIEMKLIVNFR